MSTGSSSSNSNSNNDCVDNVVNVLPSKGEDHHSFLSAEDVKLFDEWDRLSALYADAKKTKTLPIFVKPTSSKRKLDIDQLASVVAVWSRTKVIYFNLFVK